MSANRHSCGIFKRSRDQRLFCLIATLPTITIPTNHTYRGYERLVWNLRAFVRHTSCDNRTNRPCRAKIFTTRRSTTMRNLSTGEFVSIGGLAIIMALWNSHITTSNNSGGHKEIMKRSTKSSGYPKLRFFCVVLVSAEDVATTCPVCHLFHLH